MRRRIIQLCVFLLLVAIVNVAVAWGCAMWAPQQGGAPTQYGGVPDAMQQIGVLEWLAPRKQNATISYSHREIFAAGLRTFQAGITEAYDGEWVIAPHHVVHMAMAGWPMRALTCVGYLKYGEVQHSLLQEWHGGFRAPPGWRPLEMDGSLFGLYFRPVPIRPIWPGFAINPIFYALMCWLFFIAPGFVRRRIRIMRQRCVGCGYDLRSQVADDSGTIRCPECGTTRP